MSVYSAKKISCSSISNQCFRRQMFKLQRVESCHPTHSFRLRQIGLFDFYSCHNLQIFVSADEFSSALTIFCQCIHFLSVLTIFFVSAYNFLSVLTNFCQCIQFFVSADEFLSVLTIFRQCLQIFVSADEFSSVHTIFCQC